MHVLQDSYPNSFSHAEQESLVDEATPSLRLPQGGMMAVYVLLLASYLASEYDWARIPTLLLLG